MYNKLILKTLHINNMQSFFMKLILLLTLFNFNYEKVSKINVLIFQ